MGTAKKKIIAEIVVLTVVIIALIYGFGTYFGPPQAKPSPEPSPTATPTPAPTPTPTPKPIPTKTPVVKPPFVFATPTPAPTPSPTPSPSPTATPSPTPVADADRFVVYLNATSTDQVATALYTQGFVKSETAFSLAYAVKGGTTVAPGGYKLTKDMSALQVVDVLRAAPYMKWAVIPEGLRKEEVGGILAQTLGWTASTTELWKPSATTTLAAADDYVEGVYFPDSYLIPVDEPAPAVADRIIAHFNEKFAPYIPQFAAENIQWTTGLTMASLVQREAANDADMPLIAGILWNRIDQNIPLGVDATLQYARGNTGAGWWAPIAVADKDIDSPFNTYTHKGLPPHPIANPGIAAIEATLHPTKTDCIYYLHDADHVIHCAATYAEHQDNIEKYLKAEPTPTATPTPTP